MPSFIDKLKPSSHKNNDQDEQVEGQRREEPTFSIQPHPAQKTNDPRDLEPQQPDFAPAGQNVAHGPGPVIPNQEMLNNMGQPKSREELKARSAQLNRQQDV
ncbi:hypothetical protein EIP86_003810 [Pleurotus ostreatoroseus]|nr:hypothetical protein EIP86_003810 [Pleurotus ostreatoroseus]